MQIAPVAASQVGDTLLVRMREHADLTSVAAMPRGAGRRTAAWNALVDTAARTQAPALEILNRLRASGAVTAIETLPVANDIIVDVQHGSIQAVTDALRGVAAVAQVEQNRTWSTPNRIPEGEEPTILPDGESIGTGDVAWGVAQIGAPTAWARGVTGAGVTIGVVDTGLDAAHPAIAPHYRGTNADGTQTNDYNWFDPAGHAAVPFDDDSHGTHVSGTAAGGSEGHAVGVAPGARLIAAKAIRADGFNTTDATLRALQFMLAPTRTDGTAPDPTRGADVVNNSWGDAKVDDDTFRDTWTAMTAAGIELVSAAGNDGPSGKISPPASYPGAISVAATTPDDRVTGFSSRGPSKFDPAAILPNVSAPGQRVVSSVPGGRYGTMSGTSQATPHVVGAVALLLSAHPQATHEQIVQALTSTAHDIEQPGPDLAAGYGRIDVPAALAWLDAHAAG